MAHCSLASLSHSPWSSFVAMGGDGLPIDHTAQLSVEGIARPLGRVPNLCVALQWEP